MLIISAGIQRLTAFECISHSILRFCMRAYFSLFPGTNRFKGSTVFPMSAEANGSWKMNSTGNNKVICPQMREALNGFHEHAMIKK
jgi:hypothetical protein